MSKVGDTHMPHLVRNHKLPLSAFWIFLPVLTLIISLASCSKSEKPKAESEADKSSIKTFASPADAGAALLEAFKSGEPSALVAIFGPDAKKIFFTGDAVKDKNTFQDFVDAYGQMNRWSRIKAGGEVLRVGADNYPFPIPLGQNSSGQWYFDTAAGKDEILARRIGKAELIAIAACSAIAGAQQEYFKQAHNGTKQYAQKFVSDAGKQDGLYWPVPEGQPPSPLGQLGDFAKAAGYSNAGNKPQPFNGYYFQMLTKQGDKANGGAKGYIVNGKMTGGFAILAYPAEYRDSGIMTFIVSTDGVVYQKDLGEKTTDVAATMTEYNPGDGWSPSL